MTTLISQYSSSSSNMITSSDSNPIQTNSSSSTSTRFSLSLPIDTTTTTKSNNYILKSTSLISALISPHHHHHHHHHSNHQESNQSNHPHQINTNLLQQPDQTLSSSSASSINHKNRLPRPRALSSSHLPPPFPSPSGTFLPPPSTHYLPLKLPSHSDRKSRTNHPSRSNSNTINGHLDGENQEGLKTSKVHHHHRRSSSLQTLPTLHRSEEAHQTRKRSASSTMMDSSRIPNSNLIPKHHHPILIRDFGFPLTDDRHYKTIHTDHMKAHARNPRDSMNTDGLEERFQSSLSLPPEEEEEEEEEEGRVGCKKANLWTTTMSSERPGMTEDETEEEDEDGLREEIERRRESLDKSLQSIGRPSIGSGLDSSDLEEEAEEEEEEEGLWVALYDFVAEGEGEMGIYEGEILRVCKVVCDGWVIARKVPGELDEDGRFVERVLGFEKPHHSLDDEIEQQQENDDDQMGLCPQNYLARI